MPGTSYAPGTKVYTINREKCVLAATIGTKNLEEGFHLNIAHIDSPRLDLRPVPVFEKTDIGYLRTHYYGGVRKYQWPTIPLALHGVIYRADGTRVNVCIGEKDDDPVFCITDLLPHLGAQAERPRRWPRALPPRTSTSSLRPCPSRIRTPSSASSSTSWAC